LTEGLRVVVAAGVAIAVVVASACCGGLVGAVGAFVSAVVLACGCVGAAVVGSVCVAWVGSMPAELSVGFVAPPQFRAIRQDRRNS